MKTKTAKAKRARTGILRSGELVGLRRYHEKQIRIHRDVLQSAGLKSWCAWAKRQIKRHEKWLEIIKSIKPRLQP